MPKICARLWPPKGSPKISDRIQICTIPDRAPVPSQDPCKICHGSIENVTRRQYNGDRKVEILVENVGYSGWKSEGQAAALTVARNASGSRQQRWNRKNIRTASCKLSIPEMEQFRRCCDRRGITRYEALRYMIAVFMAECKRQER